MNRDAVKAALIFMLVGLVFGGVIGYDLSTRDRKPQAGVNERDSTTYVDTILYYMPVSQDCTVVRYETRYLPKIKPQAYHTDTLFTGNYAQNTGENIPPQALSDERDSTAVEIPITQKRYEGENYRAYVSGFEPALDSIFVYPKTTVIREQSYKPPNKWHIGITGGYSYGFKSKQAEPYIGVGITYSIFSF